MPRLTDVETTVEIVDGRVAMDVRDDARLYFDTPDRQPLSAGEAHATLRVTGDGFDAAVDLDAEGLDALADAVYDAQERDD